MWNVESYTRHDNCFTKWPKEIFSKSRGALEFVRKCIWESIKPAMCLKLQFEEETKDSDFDIAAKTHQCICDSKACLHENIHSQTLLLLVSVFVYSIDLLCCFIFYSNINTGRKPCNISMRHYDTWLLTPLAYVLRGV